MDSVTRRMCHFVYGNIVAWRGGDHDLWVLVPTRSYLEQGRVLFVRQEAYVFPDELSARDALDAIGKSIRLSVVPFMGDRGAGQPLWQQVR